MKLRSYLVVFGVTLLVPVLAGSGVLIARFGAWPDPARPSGWMLLACGGGLGVVGALLATFVGRRDQQLFENVDALPTLHALAPRAAIIMVSGSTDVELSRRALAHGAFDYVIKPIDFEYLARSLETALAMKDV